MTKRDKLLLTILLTAAVLFLPNYFITKNIVNNIIKTKDDIAQLRVKEQEFIKKQADYEITGKELKALMSKWTNSKPNNEKYLKSYEVHYLFTEIIQQNKLDLENLTLGDQIVQQKDPIGIDAFAVFSNESLHMEDVDILDYSSQAIPDIVKQTVTFTIKGTMEKILSTVDTINAINKYITVDNISIPDMEKSNEIEANIATSIYTIVESNEAEQQ